MGGSSYTSDRTAQHVGGSFLRELFAKKRCRNGDSPGVSDIGHSPLAPPTPITYQQLAQNNSTDILGPHAASNQLISGSGQSIIGFPAKRARTGCSAPAVLKKQPPCRWQAQQQGLKHNLRCQKSAEAPSGHASAASRACTVMLPATPGPHSRMPAGLGDSSGSSSLSPSSYEHAAFQDSRMHGQQACVAGWAAQATGGGVVHSVGGAGLSSAQHTTAASSMQHAAAPSRQQWGPEVGVPAHSGHNFRAAEAARPTTASSAAFSGYSRPPEGRHPFTADAAVQQHAATHAASSMAPEREQQYLPARSLPLRLRLDQWGLPDSITQAVLLPPNSLFHTVPIQHMACTVNDALWPSVNCLLQSLLLNRACAQSQTQPYFWCCGLLAGVC